MKTVEIGSFLDRCRFNLTHDTKNDFIGMRISSASEKPIQKKMHKAGFAEFNGSSESWPSLYLSVDEWEKTPYHSAVHLDLVKSSHFSFQVETMRGNELFNYDEIQKDPERELNDWMKLRSMDRNFEAICLFQDDQDWMIDAPGEAATNDKPALKAHGKVLTFGLGIGYFIFMAMRNPNVTSIDCVESSPEVIQMFKRFLLPQFPTANIPLNIIHGDAFVLWNKSFLSQYDYVYTDIYQSSLDGLKVINRLLEQYIPPLEQADFWIENSCFEVMWTLIWIYFDDLYNERKNAVSPAYIPYMKKIQHYFDAKDETISDVQKLKYYMYDNETIRIILSGK